MFIRWLLLVLMSLFCLSSSSDHGGVAMGPHAHCDTGRDNLEIDWDPQSTAEHTCTTGYVAPDLDYVPYDECEEHPKPAFHECYPNRVLYNGIPMSGSHRPVWAAYGEYRYCPPQRWLHNLEHSAIVMLYHPCVNQSEAEPLKKLLRRCVRRHIITPSKLLHQSLPYAFLSWGCKLIMATPNLTLAEQYIRDHARDGPEFHTYSGGAYRAALISESTTLRGSDYHDSTLCPVKEKEYQEKKEKEAREKAQQNHSSNVNHSDLN